LIGVVWLYYRLRSVTSRKLLLLVASYIFYGAWDPRFLGLIFLTTCIDYVAGWGITVKPSRKYLFLLLSIVSNLAILFTFKYFHFFVDSFIGLMSMLGVSMNSPTVHVILPIGLSFYTFKSLSFTIDMYRGRLQMPSFLDMSVFISFFPLLVAG